MTGLEGAAAGVCLLYGLLTYRYFFGRVPFTRWIVRRLNERQEAKFRKIRTAQTRARLEAANNRALFEAMARSRAGGRREVAKAQQAISMGRVLTVPELREWSQDFTDKMSGTENARNPPLLTPEIREAYWEAQEEIRAAYEAKERGEL